MWVVSGALLVGALGMVVFATPLFGNRALIVRSGSMEPAIAVGDLVVVRSVIDSSSLLSKLVGKTAAGAAGYSVGDVISYNVPGRDDMLVTHRVVEVRGDEYVTKGDANAEDDSWVITQGDIIGEELFVVPWVGTLLAFAKSRIGFMSLVVAPALVVVLSELRVIWGEMRKRIPYPERGSTPSNSPSLEGESKKVFLPSSEGRLGGVDLQPDFSFIGSPPPRVRRFVDGISLRVATIVFVVAIMTPATFALYTDTGTSSNNLFTAADDFGGIEVGDVVINEIMWMGTDVSTSDEWIELRNMTSEPIDLTGWKILNAGTSSPTDITLSGTIAANDYWLLGNNSAGTSAILDTITVDQVTTGVELVNGGEQLTLKDPGNVTIDSSPVTSGSWTHGDNSPDQQSMSRNDPPGDGTVVSNWHTCIDPGCNDGTFWDAADGDDYGTPRATNL